MATDEDISLGSIAKKGLGFLNSKLNEAIEAGKNTQKQGQYAPYLQAQQVTTYCTNCGTNITGTPKFCPECGSAMFTDAQTIPAPTTPPVIPDQSQGGYAERTQQYAGVINKCPNCGEIIDAFDAVCDACGYRIAGRSVTGSTRQFHEELLAIERNRKKHKFFSNETISETDKQIIALINTFPIPNTVEELSEFMFMTSSSISVEYSKKPKNALAKAFVSYEGTAEKAVSDAWLSKMKQVYNKAKLSFSDDPVFVQIQQVYDEKMAELNMA